VRRAQQLAVVRRMAILRTAYSGPAYTLLSYTRSIAAWHIIAQENS